MQSSLPITFLPVSSSPSETPEQASPAEVKTEQDTRISGASQAVQQMLLGAGQDLFEEEVYKFLVEVRLKAPAATACIKELKKLARSAKGTISSPALSNRLAAILQKHIQSGSFEPLTPLTWAVTKNSKLFVEWLLDHGERADLPDSTKALPLEYAVSHHLAFIAELLFRRSSSQLKPSRPNIYVFPGLRDTPSSFDEATLESWFEALEKIPVAQRLLEKIGRGPHPIFITSGLVGTTFLGELELRKGCSSIISFSGRGTSYISPDGTSCFCPNFVSLAHELIHACHNSYGKNRTFSTGCDSTVWTDPEEYHTIMGFPSKNPDRKTPKITQNAILAALGLPERISHCSGEVLNEPHNPTTQRILATAKQYKRFCDETHYHGQAHNPPPPMVQVP